MDHRKEQVWAVVKSMNHCWTSGNAEDLRQLPYYFHERMVAVTPTDRLRREGRGACLAGWEQFARMATITSWVEEQPKIDLFGDTAVVSYYYRLSCVLGGEPLLLTGRDLLTLIYEDGRWQMVADQFSPFPPIPNGGQ